MAHGCKRKKPAPNAKLRYHVKRKGKRFAVIENGGDDVEKNDDSFRITSSPADFEKLLNALKKDNFSIINAELSMKPDNTIDLEHETAEKLLKILDFIDEIEDVQEVYSNGGFPDDFKID